MPKKKWIKPMLTVLVSAKDRPEMVLTACKQLSSGAAVQNYNSGCNLEYGGCWVVCSSLGPS